MPDIYSSSVDEKNAIVVSGCVVLLGCNIWYFRCIALNLWLQMIHLTTITDVGLSDRDLIGADTIMTGKHKNDAQKYAFITYDASC